MEMMEEDEPLSSSEAPRAPALDTEESLSTPVAGPETPFRLGHPVCHVWRLLCVKSQTYFTHLLGLKGHGRQAGQAADRGKTHSQADPA